MSLIRQTFWKTFFRANCLFNFGMSVGCLLFENSLREALKIPRDVSVYRLLFLAMVFVFGISYWWIARDLARGRDLVRLGLVGKLTVFCILGYATLIQNSLPKLFLVPGLLDLALATGFWVFLRTYPTLEKAGQAAHLN